MIILKLAVDIACGALFAWGGYSFLAARRYIMPSLLAVSCLWAAHSWWALSMLPVMGTLSLGYKNFGEGNFARAEWLALQAFVIGIGLCITGHFAWYFFAPYVAIAGVLAGILNNRVKQVLGDIIFGSWLGIIILFIS